MQESFGGESSASAKRALAKVRRLLQVVSTKRNALALKDYRKALEECLKTEASTTMKIPGYRLASRGPSCSTFSTWQFVLDECVTELASSQNAPILLYAISLLQQIPLPLLLTFLISSEKEPMNKLRTVLAHEQSDVRCCAIATLSKVSLSVATSVAAGGPFAFPFEPHEARICCQQDLWIVVTDTWKVIFQALFLEDEMADVAGVAFAAMRMLFARGSMLNAFSFNKEPQLTQSAVNDVIASVFKEAFPRILSIQGAAKKLSLKYQVDAVTWIAMLLYTMMEKSGARCPGVSVSYLDIDVISDSSQTDDDQPSASTRRMRMDQLASDLLESWIYPLLSTKASLTQSTALCRAMFLLLSHPLQEFVRLKRSALLVQQLVAQCYYHKSSDFKLEMSQMLVKAFVWVSPSECGQLFVRTAEAISLMERETDRQGFLQMLMDAAVDRVVRKQEFLVLESLCAKDFFRQPSGSSVLAPRANGSQVFCCLVQALVLRADSSTASCVQVAQLIVLKAFQKLLLAKTKSPGGGDASASPPSNQLCYTALLSLHFQNLVRSQALLFRESLQFFQNDVQRAWPQITASDVRIQLLWVGIHLSATYQVVPPQRLLKQIHLEIQEQSASERVSDMATIEPNETNATFDDGKLGGLESERISKETKHKTSIESLVALRDCMALMVQLNPSRAAALQQGHERLQVHVASTASASSLQHHMMQEQLHSLSAAVRGKSLYSQETFHPSHLSTPQKHRDVMSSEMRSPNSLLHADALSDVEHEAVIATGSADPFSLHVAYKHPLPGHEDTVAICCNLTNVPLSDFEIHIRPLGAVKCVDGPNDLKLRLMQGGNASGGGGLPCFGVRKGEKRFQVQAFAQTSFFFQVVFSEVDTSVGGDGQPQAIPIRLASSLTKAPVRDWRVFPAHVAKRCCARVDIIQDLLVDTPIQIHIAFLTETRWEQFVAASVTLTASCGAPAEDSVVHAQWSGVLEVRSSSASTREFVKAPQDALHVFCGHQYLQITSDPSKRMVSADLHTEEALQTTSAGLQRASESASNPFSTGAMLSSTTAFPGMDFTTSSGGDRGMNKSDAAWAASPFDNPFDTPEQLRPASNATFHDPWGM